ncbi:MAG: hypothetical protein D8M58_00370 [Calditrichaeota bacterium]|nr:MAG: hypothetical protein DWQ03_06710 [Calditrichota bacterium]MBL1203824.1 hypothetical protein [Calditrichota bacterium]NOG43655.1 hypothetical protein [Calditrichota bacterium]
MNSEHRKVNQHFIRMAGTFSIMAGIFVLASIFYVFVVLGSMGLEFSMFEDTKALLTWIDANKLAYSILWVHYAIIGVLMLPAPLAASQVFRQHSNRSSSMATVSYLVGLCGFYLLIIASIVFFTISPITAKAFTLGTNNSLLLHEIFVALGMQFRLFGEFMIGLWIAGIGIHRVRKNKIDSFGWYCVVFAVSSTIITIAKSFNLFDWEPLLGMALAFTYIWLGWIMRQKSK